MDTNSDVPPVLRKIQRLFPKVRPEKIQHLWHSKNETTPRNEFNHLLAEHLHMWASKEEIMILLNDTQELESIYSDVCKYAVQLGMTSVQNAASYSNNDCVTVATCVGCNQPCDNGGTGCASHELVKENFQNEILHRLIILMTVLCHVLTYPEADAFVLILTKPFDINIIEQGKFDVGLTAALVGIFDNCTSYPKVNHITAGFFSLICTRRPSATLGGLDEKLFVPALFRYLRSTLALVANNACIVDDYFGICAFLNILPLLFHLGTWKVSHCVPQFRDVTAVIGMITVNICHWIAPPNGEDENDSRPSLVDLPETIGAQILIERMITDEDGEESTNGKWRKDLLEQHPKSFAVIAAVEVLGWYSYNGIDLRIPVPVTNGPPTVVSGILEEYEESIIYLIRRHPDLAYIESILDALLHHKKPPKPHQIQSLLYGPLCNARRRCGLPSCRSPDVGARCSACGGMEYYCSKEHQKMHWKEHKPICRKHCTSTGR